MTLNKYNYDKSDELHIIMLCNMTFLGAYIIFFSSYKELKINHYENLKSKSIYLYTWTNFTACFLHTIALLQKTQVLCYIINLTWG